LILIWAVLLEERTVLWGELKETYTIASMSEMKKAILKTIAISALLISLMVSMNLHSVKADSTDSISFDSGVTVYSPLSKLYNCRNLTLNLSIGMVGIIHSDGQPVTGPVVMNYSIDGKYSGRVPLWSNAGTHMIISGYGIMDLPELPDGGHTLTIILYGYNMQGYQPQFKSYVNTVYFLIYDPNTTFVPTPSPIPTPTVIPTPSSSPTPTPSPTPSILPSPSPTMSPSPSPTPSPSPITSPSPSTSPNPSSSPTQQPTIEPAQTDAPTLEPKNSINTLSLTTGVIFVAIVAIVAVLVYFSKFRK
jgi:hypothetical protein